MIHQKTKDQKITKDDLKRIRGGVLTANLSGSAQGGETLPMEEISFKYGKVEYTNIEHKIGTSGIIGTQGIITDYKE